MDETIVLNISIINVSALKLKIILCFTLSMLPTQNINNDNMQKQSYQVKTHCESIVVVI